MLAGSPLVSGPQLQFNKSFEGCFGITGPLQITVLLDHVKELEMDIRPHLSADYVDLPDIDNNNTGTLTESEDQCLGMLGNLIAEYGFNHRFGVTLLHYHFAVDDSEIFLEEPSREMRMVTTRPIQKSSIDFTSVVPINIRFLARESLDGQDMVGLEYVSMVDFPGIEAVQESDAGFLKQFEQVLTTFSGHSRFGLGVIHDSLEIGEDEVLLEHCNGRSLHCNVALRSTVAQPNIIETFWTWKTLTDGIDGMKWCEKSCSRACFKSDSGSHSSGHASIHHNSNSW